MSTAAGAAVRIPTTARWQFTFWLVLGVLHLGLGAATLTTDERGWGLFRIGLGVSWLVLAAAMRRAAVAVDDGGVSFTSGFRPVRLVPWGEIERVDADWATTRPLARPLRLRTAAGEDVVVPVADLSGGGPSDEREALDAALRHHTAARGITLEIVPPAWSAAFEQGRRDVRDR